MTRELARFARSIKLLEAELHVCLLRAPYVIHFPRIAPVAIYITAIIGQMFLINTREDARLIYLWHHFVQGEVCACYNSEARIIMYEISLC